MKREELAQVAARVFSAPEGQQLLQAIEKECFFNRGVFCEGSERLTSYNLGKQSVAIWLHGLIESIERKS